MFSTKKPYSAITVQVDSLTSDRFQVEDLSGIPDLVEVIKLQGTGPTEAARAIRKKLKYGSVHAQLRALVLLNGLVENGGPKVQKQIWDEPLLERLRACGQSDAYDKRVRDKCALYFSSWQNQFKTTPGMEDVANLYRMLPRRKRDVTIETSKMLKEQNERDPFEDDEDDKKSPSTPQKPEAGGSQASPPVASSSKQHRSKGSISSSFFGSSQTVSSKDKSKSKKSARVFDEAKEKETIKRKIADSHVESAAMLDVLRRVDRAEQRISENVEAKAQLEKIKRLRQYMRRYVTMVQSDEFLGPLLAAHDALMNAIVTFEQLDRSIDADSDSDDELAEQQHAYRMLEERQKEDRIRQHQQGSAMTDMVSIHIPMSGPPSPPSQPPRPPAARPPPNPDPESEEEDEDDPFGDSNAVDTPTIEQGEPKWRSV